LGQKKKNPRGPPGRGAFAALGKTMGLGHEGGLFFFFFFFLEKKPGGKVDGGGPPLHFIAYLTKTWGGAWGSKAGLSVFACWKD